MGVRPSIPKSALAGRGGAVCWGEGTATGWPLGAGVCAPRPRPITDSTAPTATNVPAMTMNPRRGMGAPAAGVDEFLVGDTGASAPDSHVNIVIPAPTP